MSALDNSPSLEEVGKVIDVLKCGKARGEDEIPPGIIKSSKSALQGPLHELLYPCWEESEFRQDMCDSKIVTFYKAKETSLTVTTTEASHS